jgi:hypothetical protein
MSTQNIIQGIVSPKVVSDGSGGYKVSADLVNVDNITITGSYSGSFSTNQSGKAQLSNGTASITNASITSSSVILLTPIGSSTGGTATQYSVNVLNNTGFNIYSSNTSDTSYVNWFIAKF